MTLGLRERNDKAISPKESYGLRLQAVNFAVVNAVLSLL